MPTPDPLPFANTPPARKLTHEQAREEQRLYWAGKTAPERLAALAQLNQRLLHMRGIDLHEPWSAFPVSRVRRRKD